MHYATLAIGLAACAHSSMPTSATTTEPADEPTGHIVTIYSDDNLRFVTRDFGGSGTQTPGLFVEAHGRWRRITRISLANAKLGRAPTLDEASALGKHPASVSWDYSRYAGQASVELPLHTSGSIALPERIALDRARDTYVLYFDESWALDAVTTRLEILRADLSER